MTSTELPHKSHMHYSEYTQFAVRINMALLKVHRLQKEVDALKKDVDSFLEEYFSSIAKQLHPSFLLQAPSANAQEEIPAISASSKTAEMDKLMHQLYKRLAQQCHPDIHPDIAHDAMSKVNAAYQNKELGSLMMLSEEVFGSQSISDASFSIDDLKQYHEHIHVMIDELEKEHDALASSDANRLRKEMLIAKLQGNDIIEHVVDGIKNAISITYD